MNVALRQRVSLAEFLAWEERQELKYEFDRCDAYAMVGVTRVHATIQVNPIGSLTQRLRGDLPPAELPEELDLSQAANEANA